MSTLHTIAFTAFFALLSGWTLFVAEHTQRHVDKINQENIVRMK